MSFVLLSHYNTITIKKESKWYIGRKKYNIYYVYNYILPQEPLKMSIFRESMIWVSWQYGD